MLDLIIFPNQLFRDHPGLAESPSRVVLIEDSLFFGDARYPLSFHKQKLWLHRATMKRYEQMLREQGIETKYIEYDSEPNALSRQLSKVLGNRSRRKRELLVAEPVDFILEKRLLRFASTSEISCRFLPTPAFINTESENREYHAMKERWFMADFYKWQRMRHAILMEGDAPVGGKWSFDEDNRKKLPKKWLQFIPEQLTLDRDGFDQEAKAYVENRFARHPGNLDQLYYPSSHGDAERWLEHFLSKRLGQFGDFEDAIVQGQSWLWHSVLTPVLNVGLLTPRQVIDETLSHGGKHDVTLNSLEGFIRQVIGWREFMRATYQDLGVPMRTTNHWHHHRAMPHSFYDGSTGIPPIDDTIKRILETGYCHHIERLMVLGGFMFLCEIDPDEIYRWFMEMFVDSYDWVMVPNVYAMSQNADGGRITTKPYFSGSAYVRKMSHYAPGPWCDAWDGLYWRWVMNHSDALRKNPRWAMMCSMAAKMDESTQARHRSNAEAFLRNLR